MVLKLAFRDGMIISFFPKVPMLRLYLNIFETIHLHFLQNPCFQTLNSPLSIGTGNMSESYVEAKTVLSMRKKLLSNSEIIAG